MTTGNHNLDGYVALPGGGWNGPRGFDNHTGVDRSTPYTIPELVSTETRGMGLGAKAAKEIWTAVEQHTRESADIMRSNARSGHLARVASRLADAELRRDSRIKMVVNRRLSVQTEKDRLVAANKQRLADKAARKPYRKREWYQDLGVPFIVLARHSYPDPAKPLPKRRRELDLPHAYHREVRLWGDTTDSYQTLWWCPRLGGDLNPPVFFGKQWLKNLSADWTANSLLPVGIDTELVNKLREKLNGSDFHLGNFLGEGHQSLRLIGDTAIKLAKMYHHVKRGDFWGASRSLFENTARTPLVYRDGISLSELNRLSRSRLAEGPWGPGKLWGHVSKDANTLSARVLELQYGWRPLLQDIYGAAQSLGWILHAPYLLKERVRKKKSRYTPPYQAIKYNTYTDYGPPPGLGCQPYSVYHEMNAVSGSHKRQLLAYLRELPHGLARLGLADPATVLWELTPWSFVVDWALPIGDYLTARGFATQLSGTFVTTDVKTGKAGDWSDFVMDRSVSTSLSIPMPQVKPLAKAASFQHCLNGLALLTQVVTGYTAKVR